MPKFCRQYEHCLKNSARDFSLPDCQFLNSGKLRIDSVMMYLTADQDRILQLVENENDSPQVPRRDDKSEHPEGRKEHTEKHVRKILDIQKRTRTRQENQAERMRSELQPGEVGNSMTIAIPPVDRGCGDARNSISVITVRQQLLLQGWSKAVFAARSLLSQSV